MKIITRELPEIKIEDIVCAYVGKAGACACGCSGNYIYTKARRDLASKRRGYKVTDDEVSDERVQQIIDEIRDLAIYGVEVLSVNEGFCLTLVVWDKEYSLYTV